MKAAGGAPVVFDGAVLGAGPLTGVGGSFLTTLAVYAERAPRDCVLLLPEGLPAPGIEGVRIERQPRGGLRRRHALPGILRRLGAALLHSPVAALPRSAGCPMIATLHDLPWMAPAFFAERGRGLRARLAARRAARVASAIVVPSRSTLQDLLRYLGEDLAPRVHHVPHGVAAPQEPARAEDLCGPFLVLGDDRPRKNIERVRRAHARARELEPALPDLRIAGPRSGWLCEDEKLRALRRARALLHLSLFEGFGLPVLEAFAHGVPVLCSAGGSLAELAKGAALEADPQDEEGMARAIARIHRDEARRRELRARGLERARALPVEACADAWLELHARLCR